MEAFGSVLNVPVVLKVLNVAMILNVPMVFYDYCMHDWKWKHDHGRSFVRVDADRYVHGSTSPSKQSRIVSKIGARLTTNDKQHII